MPQTPVMPVDLTSLYYGQPGQPVALTVQHVLTSSNNLWRRLAHTGSLAGHTGPVQSVSWNTAGTLLASGSDDCRIKLWDAARGQARRSIDSVRGRAAHLAQ